MSAVLAWENSQRAVSDWRSSQSIRFRQDVTDPATLAAKKQLDAWVPMLEESRNVFLKTLLGGSVSDGIRRGLEERFGAVTVARWGAEARTYSEAAADELSQEQSLMSEAMALTGSARVEIGGETMTLSGAGALLNHEDRDVRTQATVARWGWFGAHRETLDAQFDSLVAIRTKAAKALGLNSFTDLAYDRMRRVDYGPNEVARFREAIESRIVPIVSEMRRDQAKRLGLAQVQIQDESAFDQGPPPRPTGTPSDLCRAARGMFEDIDRRHGLRLGELFGTLEDADLLDLVARPGKGPGGFCSFLPKAGLPFVFANFNGSLGDVRVFTHEMGHAYQGWCSHRALEIADQRRCTSESAEIHSMSLEWLTWPWMDRFFGDYASRFRADHIAGQVAFLPYGCAIDHFQHDVYASPSATPSERHGMWKEAESRYLPTRDWGGIEHGESGAAWQAQLHVYQYPFYYIDYVLAQTVALQFLVLSQEDEGEAWRRFQTLCDLGGSLGFRELVQTAGLGDPFDPDVLEATVLKALDVQTGA